MFPYIPRGEGEEATMLDAIGVGSFEDLLAPLPQAFRVSGLLALPGPQSEHEIAHDLARMAGRNKCHPDTLAFLGAGCYDHMVPAAIDHVAYRSEFYTAYTPYQAEVGQGTLTAIFEFQTVMAELTGMDLANASLYDGASALAEAAWLGLGATGRNKILVAGPLHPNYRHVLATYTQGLDVEILVDPAPAGVTDAAWVERHLDDTVGVVVGSSPNFLGGVEDFTALFAEAKKRGAVTVSVFQPHALMLYKTPGAMGADLAVGEGRSLGTPPSFGGPALGLFAVTGAYVRSIPGRLIGETVDRQGKRCYVMTLRTREQDIRRAKATSNICTNQSLLALRATLYASLLGPRGMREVAERCVENAHYAADRLSAAGGFRLAFEAPFFQEFALECPRPAREVVAAAESRGVLAGVDLGRFRPEWERLLLVCCNEKHRRRDLDTLVDVLSAGAGEVARV